MTGASEDVAYRDFTLSSVQQGGQWLVTVWPTRVEQALPSPSDSPFCAATRDQALALARSEVDRVLGAADTVDRGSEAGTSATTTPPTGVP